MKLTTDEFMILCQALAAAKAEIKFNIEPETEGFKKLRKETLEKIEKAEELIIAL